MASEIAAPKPDLDAKATKRPKGILKRKITSAKIATIFWQISVAAWMRPLQYDLQSAAAKDKSVTHAAAARSNLDAAPFQCNLRPQLQETHRTTHTDTTTRCKTHRRNNSRTKRPQPHPSHRRGTFHRRLQPLYTEKQGFVLRLPPQNIAHATFMQPLQCVSQHPVANPHLSTHVATSNNDDNEAAIPMQFATRDSRTA